MHEVALRRKHFYSFKVLNVQTFVLVGFFVFCKLGFSLIPLSLLVSDLRLKVRKRILKRSLYHFYFAEKFLKTRPMNQIPNSGLLMLLHS
mgnify:CR=1 FL=1